MIRLTEQFEARLNDQEGRARRSNIRIYGVPEKAEANSSDFISFLEDLLKSTLDLNSPADLQIERAHRALAPTPSAEAKPRSIIAKFLNYRTKELVIKTAWEKKVIEWKGNRIFCDHDYAPDVLWKRRKYQDAKRMLREHDIRFQTRFPARLRVFYTEGTVIYNSAEEAATDMVKRGLPVTVLSTPSSLTERVQRLTWRKTGKRRDTPAHVHPSYKDKFFAFRRSQTEDK
ncbi:putative transposase element L1Md-A101/L1Md-A102/L1Md-A2 [Labeo rohita]|uniref:Putative transposase element L1Md-A101/L1Md-A102/L1Md-A2 n=1 Tax=Labeo rohita TaxID=84645 RepID=A0A498P3Z2_LABRO|nr:putative transposase element L1Md-A101/L1Md-A102/L1Md-A2 [Labeo rohita]RXN38935.1 putative transposase element L1Md-A101/L1Md-A102/L1Md-A2 [Labeo rohita]